MCRKQSGIAIGRLCDKCDGKCPVCDSYVRPTTLVRICDECSFGNYQNKCVVCGGEGISDAFYCYECTRLEKDRDGCPKIINLGSSRTDVCFSASLARCPSKTVHAYTNGFISNTAILPKENESASKLLAKRWPGFGQDSSDGLLKKNYIYQTGINHVYASEFGGALVTGHHWHLVCNLKVSRLGKYMWQRP